jgi:hypothetical protein
MSSTSHTKSPRLSWVSSHLALAEAVLDLQVRTNAITRELALMPRHRSGARCLRINWKGLAETISALRELLSTPAMQALVTGLLPLIAGIGKWLLRLLFG